MMTRSELVELYDKMKRLDMEMWKAKAPMSVRRNVHDSLLSISWMIDYREEESD